MDQGNAFERAGTNIRMGVQGAVWPWQIAGPAGMTIPLDVCEFDNEFVVRATLPGVTPDALEVSVIENSLTLKGEFKAPDWMRQPQGGKQSSTSGAGPTCWIQENPVGKFARTISLPYPVDAGGAQASFDNGILTLRLPKSQTVMVQKIPVQPGSFVGSAARSSGPR